MRRTAKSQPKRPSRPDREGRKCVRGARGRSLRIESLEERHMLSLTPTVSLEAHVEMKPGDAPSTRRFVHRFRLDLLDSDRGLRG